MTLRPATTITHSKRLVVVGTVVGTHVLGLWAMQNGLIRRTVEDVLPAVVMAELIEAPQPEMPPPPPPPEPKPPVPAPPRPQPVVKPAFRPVPAPAPVPVAQEPAPLPAPAPAPVPAPAVESTRAPEAAVPPAPLAAPAAPPAPAPVPRIELPSSDPAHLNNPRPAYPSLSKRLGEQGKVVIRVLISATGEPIEAQIQTSSGYERLDQTALQTVMKWRYVPGKRNGVTEQMWTIVPIVFQIKYN